MKKKANDFKTNLVVAIVMTIFFIVFTALVANVEVREVGECASKVGFASLNEKVHEKLPYNETWYNVSEIMGYFAIAIVAVWGAIGVKQLIKWKSLKAVDTKLYILAAFYVIMLALYIIFDKIAINLRPVIIDAKEGLEPSYPSSHTFLAIFVCLSSIIMCEAYIKKNKYRKIVNALTLVLMVAVILTRLMSGAHWITDIIGSLLAGSMLLSFFGLAMLKFD